MSQKQATVVSVIIYSLEYIALGSATQEAIWLHQLLNDLRIGIKGSIETSEDDQSSMSMVKNSIGHRRTQYIDIKHHFIREAVHDGNVSQSFCPIADFLADSFAKQLPRTQFEKLRNRSGMT